MKMLGMFKSSRDERTADINRGDNYIDPEGIIAGVLSAIIVLALLLLIYKGTFLITGEKKTFLMGDSLLQYVPVIRMFLRHLLEGDSLTYSFEVGMGMPTWSIYAYYSLSPFNLLFLLIADIDQAAFCVMAGKLMLAAAMFSMLIFKTVRPGRTVTVMLATAYSLCGFTVTFYMGLIFFDMLYLMPMVFLAQIHLIKTGKWKPLCIIYAVCFMMQFYCGYMIGLFSGVLFLCYTVFYYGEFQGRRSVIGRYVLAVVTAILLSAPVTLPAARELLSHLDSEAGTTPDLYVNIGAFLAGLYPGRIEAVYNHYPSIYSGLPVLILTGGFFTRRSISAKEKIRMAVPLLFLFLCTFWKPAYLMIHAFDDPDGYAFRFSWLYSFWLLYISAMELKCLQEGNDKKIWIHAVIWCSIYLVLWILDHFSANGSDHSVWIGGISICLLMLYAVCIWYFHSGRGWKYGMLLFLLGELTINGGMAQIFYNRDITRDRGYYQIWQQQAQGALEYIAQNEAEDSGQFYRIQNSNCLHDNISMLYGYNGLGYFLSIEDEKVRKAMQALGYAASGRMLSDYGSTPFCRMVFAQKYSLLCGNWLGGQREKYSVLKNEKTLPLGYMVSEEILACDLASSNPFVNQNELASAMTGEEVSVWNLYKGGFVVEMDGGTFESKEDAFHIRRSQEGMDGNIYFLFDRTEENRMYAYLSRWGLSDNDKRGPYVLSALDIGGGVSVFSVLSMPHVIPLGAEESGNAQLMIQMPKDGEPEAEFEMVYAAYEDESGLERAYTVLAPGGWQLCEVRNGFLRGNVSVEEGRNLLFTSIPYEEEWEVYVDGEKTVQESVLNGAFLAVRLSEGEHEVIMEYKNRMILPGVLAALLGITLLLGHKTKKVEMQGDSENRKKDLQSI